jgi:F-type H+-transporting ATPase subunit b
MRGETAGERVRRAYTRWGVALTFWLMPATLWAAEGHGAGLESGFTLFMRFINFAVLGGLLFFLLRKPFRGFMGQRQKRIRESLEEARQAREDAQVRYREMEQKLTQAQHEMVELKQMLIDQGKAEREKILANAQREAEKIRRQAEIMALQELKKAQYLLREEAVELAGSMAEAILRERIAPDDHESLIRDYVETLGKTAS